MHFSSVFVLIRAEMVMNMNFLESAMIMIPFLTGIDLVVYEDNIETLDQFEMKYCFSPELQPIYTKTELVVFLKNSSKEVIYEITEPLGTHLIIIPSNDLWLLLGPYVDDEWNERASRILLSELGASEMALPMYKAYRYKIPVIRPELTTKIERLLMENSGRSSLAISSLRIQPKGRGASLSYSNLYTNDAEVSLRYQIEDLFISAVSNGDVGSACKLLDEMHKTISDLRFISEEMHDQLAGAAVIRTLIRIGAKHGGLSPMLIDSISQEYAQKMRCARFKTDIDDLIIKMIEKICSEVQEHQRSGWSVLIRRAVDYMDIHLSESMTTAEIARAVGLGQKSFVKRFHQETGTTVKEYLAKRRCAIAAQLLVDSQASVQEIGAYVGYSDNNYFSKVFRASTGLSPQAYRNKQKTSKRLF